MDIIKQVKMVRQAAVYATYQQNWGGESENALDPECVENVKRLLDGMGDELAHEVQVGDMGITSNGTVDFDIGSPDLYFFIDVGTTSMLFYCRAPDGLYGKDVNVPFTDQAIAELNALYLEWKKMCA